MSKQKTTPDANTYHSVGIDFRSIQRIEALIKEDQHAEARARLEQKLEALRLEQVLNATTITEELFRRLSGLAKAASKTKPTVPSKSVNEEASIYSPPGGLLVSVFSAVYPRKTYERIFVQAIADMREEVFDAHASHKPWSARWLTVVHYLHIIMTVIVHFFTTIGKRVMDIWKAT